MCSTHACLIWGALTYARKGLISLLSEVMFTLHAIVEVWWWYRRKKRRWNFIFLYWIKILKHILKQIYLNFTTTCQCLCGKISNYSWPELGESRWWLFIFQQRVAPARRRDEWRFSTWIWLPHVTYNSRSSNRRKMGLDVVVTISVVVLRLAGKWVTQWNGVCYQVEEIYFSFRV